MLKDGLMQWFKGDDVNVQSMGGKYEELLKEHAEVGWDQALLGGFVNHWKQVQNDHLRTLPSEQRKLTQSGSTWVTGVLNIILSDACDNWMIRCNKRHGSNDKTREALKLERMTAQTEALCDLREQVLPQFQDFFYDTLEAHAAAEPIARKQQQWMNTWGPVIRKSVKDVAALK